MDDVFDPYSPGAPRSGRSPRDPFRIMSREAWPAKEGRNARPVRPHARPSSRELPEPGEACVERGVWEEASPFPGTRSFAVMGPNSERIATVTALAGVVDEAFLAGLDRLLERYRPRPALKVI